MTTASPNAATLKEFGRYQLTRQHPTPTHYASTVILMLDGSTSSVRASLDFASGMVLRSDPHRPPASLLMR